MLRASLGEWGKAGMDSLLEELVFDEALIENVALIWLYHEEDRRSIIDIV